MPPLAGADRPRCNIMMNEPPEDYDRRQRANLTVAAAVVVLVVGTVALLLSLHQGIKREDCFAAGHRTCAPIDEP